MYANNAQGQLVTLLIAKETHEKAWKLNFTFYNNVIINAFHQPKVMIYNKLTPSKRPNQELPISLKQFFF